MNTPVDSEDKQNASVVPSEDLRLPWQKWSRDAENDYLTDTDGWFVTGSPAAIARIKRLADSHAALVAVAGYYGSLMRDLERAGLIDFDSKAIDWQSAYELLRESDAALKAAGETK